MRVARFVALTTVCGLLLMLGSGQGCLPDDLLPESNDDAVSEQPDADGTGDNGSDDDQSGDDGPAIAVTFTLSAKVVTSIGSGVDGETVNFVADKYWWDDFEEEWKFRRTMEASRGTNSAGEPGTTDAWVFGYNLHAGEKVFITATLPSSGAKQEATYSYQEASAGGGTTAAFVRQFTLDSGI